MTLRLVCLVALVIAVSATDVCAQRQFNFDDYRSSVNVTEAQEAALKEIDAHFQEKIRKLDEGSDMIQLTLRRLAVERSKALEAELTPEQRKSLNEKRKAKIRRQTNKQLEFLPGLTQYMMAIAAAEELTVYEGLPRAWDEEEEKKLETIRKENETFKIRGHDFYAEPLSPTISDTERLLAIVADHRSFEPFEPKFCGGFHPDFAIKWEVKRESKLDDSTCYLLICLGCAEASFISPTASFHVDLDKVKWKVLGELAMDMLEKHADDIRKHPAFADELNED